MINCRRAALMAVSAATVTIMARRGKQTPRIASVPPAHLPTRSGDVKELLARHGRKFDLAQRRVLDATLRMDRDQWAAYEVGLIKPRQNGKNEIIEAVELTAIQRWGTRLIVHTAHEFPTTLVALERMAKWDRAELDNPIVKVIRANGKESIEFANGAMIRYVARSKAKGRGWSDAELVVFDEAMMRLEQSMMGALLPTMAIARNPQVWYLASGVMPESDQLRHLRARARRKDPNLAWMEWSTPKPKNGRVLNLDDTRLWYECNPALGVRITPGFLRKQRGALDDEQFAREHLCVWDDNPGSGLFNEAAWAASADLAGKLGRRVALAFGVNDDLTHAALVAASPLADGRIRGELIAEWSSIERARRELGVWAEALKPGKFGWFRNSAAAAMATELGKLGKPFPDTEVPELCAELVALVGDGLVHDGNATLWSQAETAIKLPQGKRWVFDPATGCGAVYALAGAVRLARQFPTKPARRKVILPSSVSA